MRTKAAGGEDACGVHDPAPFLAFAVPISLSALHFATFLFDQYMTFARLKLSRDQSMSTKDHATAIEADFGQAVPSDCCAKYPEQIPLIYYAVFTNDRARNQRQ